MSRRLARMRARWLILVTFHVCCVAQALGHEVRPALLAITQRADGYYDVLWKQPSVGTAALHLLPQLSGVSLDEARSTVDFGSDFQVHVWRGVDLGSQGLEGRTVRIDGLERTITDALLITTLSSGESIQQIIRPQSPAVTLHVHGSGIALPAYVMLGVEHILTGFDHLAFVLGLILLVRNRLMLIKTITAFTVAHSITLIATTLHLVTVRPALVEALVALSILFVAVELLNRYRGRRGLTIRYPWLIAFAFGLLHGSAFAGALAEIGLPPHALVLSLLLFNVGVELGQLLFIAVVLLLGWSFTRLRDDLPSWTHRIPPYSIGICSAFWLSERLWVALG